MTLPPLQTDAWPLRRTGAPVPPAVAAAMAACAQAIDDLLEGRGVDGIALALSFAELIEWLQGGASGAAPGVSSDWQTEAFDGADGARTVMARGPGDALLLGLDHQGRPCLGLWRRTAGSSGGRSCTFELDAQASGARMRLDTGERQCALDLPAPRPLAWGSLAEQVESLSRAGMAAAAGAAPPAAPPAASPLASSTAISTASSIPVATAAATFCEQCGARLGAQARFCRACGAPVNPPVNATSPR